jgi:integrase/recombinase XerC
MKHSIQIHAVTSSVSPTLSTSIPMSEWVERVLEVLDVTDSSRQTYRYGIRHFLNWNPSQRVDVTTVVRYKNHLRSRKDIAISTKNLYLSGVRLFLRRLHELGVVERDFGAGVKGFTIAKGTKRNPISDDEVERVFDSVKDSCDPRIELVFGLLYYQGLRQKEILTIQVEDIDRKNSTLLIEGKGRDDKERIDLHPKTIDIISNYLTKTGIRSGYVLSSRKQGLGHIGRVQLGRLIRNVHAQCGISNTGHGWRKVYTSKLIDAGMDLLTVSSFTRHKSIELLKTYYDRLDRQRKLPVYYQTF